MDADKRSAEDKEAKTKEAALKADEKEKEEAAKEKKVSSYFSPYVLNTCASILSVILIRKLCVYY